MEKFFIVTNNINEALAIGEQLVCMDDDLDIANVFTTSEDDIENKYFILTNNEFIRMDFINNSLLFVSTGEKDYINYGISLDEYYNKDIICLGYKDFINISNYIFKDDECIIVWLDKKSNMITDSEKVAENDFCDMVDELELPIIYFTSADDRQYIVSTIYKFINGNETSRQKILEENS